VPAQVPVDSAMQFSFQFTEMRSKRRQTYAEIRENRDPKRVTTEID